MSEQNTSPSMTQLAESESSSPEAGSTATTPTAASDTAAPEVADTDATAEATSTDPSTTAGPDESADAAAAKDDDAGAGVEADAVANGADHEDKDDEDKDDEDKDDEGSELDTEAEVAADFLEELLDIADLDGDIDTYIENGRAQVSVVTDSQTLVGRDGEVLEALQEIVRLAVMAETDNRTRLMLDVAGFRDKRRITLRGLASDAVQEVRDTGESVRLSPMNPFERKIVHDTVAEAGLTSESEGTEPQRRVVVLPAK